MKKNSIKKIGMFLFFILLFLMKGFFVITSFLLDALFYPFTLSYYLIILMVVFYLPFINNLFILTSVIITISFLYFLYHKMILEGKTLDKIRFRSFYLFYPLNYIYDLIDSYKDFTELFEINPEHYE